MASKKFSKHFVQTRASLWDVISFFSFIDDSFIVVFCQFDTDSTTQSFVYIFLFLLCRFWLSLICCVLSVVCITAVNTVIQYMPLVFLMEAEKTQGDVCFIFHFYQIDFKVKLKDQSNKFINYTLVDELFHSPVIYPKNKDNNVLRVLNIVFFYVGSSNSSSSRVQILCLFVIFYSL